MVQPSDGRRPRPRPSNGAASGAAWRAAVCVNYSVHADAAEALVAEIATAMAADVEEQIEYASDILSLEAGDIFACGTCGGVGQGTTRSSTLAT
jgi:2-keto-4-pentenoate hydratase/2-oxohepta-3-ene-1,7-dioic acid hydratase in catechol pathway